MAKIDRTKEAAQAVAEKIAKGKSGNTTIATTASTPTTIDSRIPGLLTVSPELVPGMMPAFHPEKYQINDPLNPPESLPQATEQQLTRGTQIYEGSLRALKLTGLALDITREKFNVVGKHAKAIQSGLQAATQIEATKGSYLDYLNQKEVTTQKSINLEVNQVKTNIDTNIAIYSKDELAQKLKQAELKSQELRLKTIETEGKLTSFKQQLGDYLEVVK